MKSIAQVLVLASTLLLTAPTLAQDLAQSSVKQFMAKLDAAITSRDVATVATCVAENAMFSGSMQVEGQMRMFRMNKTQYLKALTLTWDNASSYTYERTNEKIAINGDQATVTADIADSATIQGQTLSSKMRETATVESVDGTLMITQVVAHERL